MLRFQYMKGWHRMSVYVIHGFLSKYKWKRYCYYYKLHTCIIFFNFFFTFFTLSTFPFLIFFRSSHLRSYFHFRSDFFFSSLMQRNGNGCKYILLRIFDDEKLTISRFLLKFMTSFSVGNQPSWINVC